MARATRVRGEIVFPNNIRDLRGRQQLTQAQVGRLMDPPLSESTISKMESGERRLTNLQLRDLASILDCDPEQIPVLAGRDDPSGVKRWEKAQEDGVRASIESGAAATGYVLAQLRKKHGKTMQQVADAIGMTLSVYHRLELASRIVQRDEIHAVATLYGLTTGRLIAMFEQRTQENQKELRNGTPPERLLPRTPRSLLKDEEQWGELGAIERYAMRRSIRYVEESKKPQALPVYGAVKTDAQGRRQFTIDRESEVGRMSTAGILPRSEDGFFVKNFSQRLGFLLRPGALAYVDPAAPVAMGDLAFAVRRDRSADAALVVGDGFGPLKLKMYNPDEEIGIDNPAIWAVWRIDMLILR